MAMFGHREQGAQAIAWRRITREKLRGSGSWSHLYGNSRNTGSSGDEQVKGPLEVLWFGEPGPVGMVDRHASGVPPLAMNGRLFVTGERQVKAYDAYNGALLWEQIIPFDGGVERLAGVHHYGTSHWHSRRERPARSTPNTAISAELSSLASTDRGS